MTPQPSLMSAGGKKTSEKLQEEKKKQTQNKKQHDFGGEPGGCSAPAGRGEMVKTKALASFDRLTRLKTPWTRRTCSSSAADRRSIMHGNGKEEINIAMR